MGSCDTNYLTKYSYTLYYHFDLTTKNFMFCATISKHANINIVFENEL